MAHSLRPCRLKDQPLSKPVWACSRLPEGHFQQRNFAEGLGSAAGSARWRLEQQWELGTRNPLGMLA